MSVFKAYDIRGTYPDEINSEVATKAAKAFAKFTGCKTVVIGRDERASSPEIMDACVNALSDMGCKVTIIGLCTTPLLNFCVAKFEYDCGIMVSASHNPGNYNALKLIRKPALQIGRDDGLAEIETLANEDNFESKEGGSIEHFNPLPEYLEHVKELIEELSGLKVVIDYGNGVGAVTAKPFFDNFNLDVTHLYENPDPSFPNHPANPHDIENFKDLQEKVVELNADLGIFFDGDADRASFVDEKGEIVFTDFIVCLLSLVELKKHPNSKVYYDLRFSKIVKEKIEESKGIAIMEKVGNPIYKKRLQKEGGLVGGEFSGHIMFHENNSIDDGLFAASKLVELLCDAKQEGKSFSEILKPLKKYYQTSELNYQVHDADKILEQLKEKYSDGKLNELDGILIEYPEFWFSLRKSNTEPLVRLRLEANSKELLSQKLDEIKEIILGKKA